MTKTILITSCKGGVGKSTVAVGLALSLAKHEKKVLLIDCDFDMRCLDLMLGLEDSVVYDLSDVIEKRVSLERAVIRDARSENFYFLAAPSERSYQVTEDGFSALMAEVKSSGGYDFILLDTPGSLVMPAVTAAGIADSAIIVASHQPISLRAACQTDEYLAEKGILERRLIINQFDLEGTLKRERPGINEIIDKSSVRLLGAIPFDTEVAPAAEKGIPACELKKTNLPKAFDHIAMRVIGYYVPLFHRFRGYSGRKIKKLFG